MSIKGGVLLIVDGASEEKAEKSGRELARLKLIFSLKQVKKQGYQRSKNMFK